ncbi:MAG: hypothetical protein AAF479_06075 [Pseudomonadota bacterium]
MAHQENAFEAYSQTGKAMFDYWISFFPTAPLFGVDWRYGDLAASNPLMPILKSTVETTVEVVEVKKEAAPVDVEIEAMPSEESLPMPAVELVEVAEEPVVEETSEPEATSELPMLYSEPPAEIDDLKAIKGVGPGLETQLHDLGIYTFEQLAGFDGAQLEWLDENLRTVKGRCIRDDWAGQAKSFLA